MCYLFRQSTVISIQRAVGLRVDTDNAAATGTTTGFTRPLPGVGKLAVPVEDEEQREKDQEAVEEEQEGAE